MISLKNTRVTHPLLYIGALLSLITTARAAAPDFGVSVQSDNRGPAVVLSPPPHHHINIKAPLSVELPGKAAALSKMSVKPAEARFALNQPVKAGEEVSYKASAFLCDDANTYCEKRTVSGKLILPASNHQTGSPSQPDGQTPQNEAATTPSKSTPNHGALMARQQGFIYNDSRRALALAKAEHKPLFIDFFGIWCPPCNMLDATVFSSPEFKKSAKRFISLKLDADAPESWELKERFRIGGYPTVVFADSSGDEITRIVGSRDKSVFLKTIDQAWKRRKTPVSILNARAKAGDAAAAYEAGVIHLERAEFDLAEPLLEQASQTWGRPSSQGGAPAETSSKTPKDPRYEKLWAARIGSLKHKLAETPSKDQSELQTRLIQTMKTAIEQTDSGVFKVMTLADLAEIYSGLGKPSEEETTQRNLITATKNLLEYHSLLQEGELKAADLWQLVGEAYKALAQQQDSREAFAKASEEYKKQLKLLGQAAAADRGFNLELAYCLAQAGRDGEAVILYQELERRYPEEFTFYFGHARLVFQKKDYKNAEPLAQKAYDFSYGDNRLRVAHLLAQIYDAEGKTKEALRLLEQTLVNITLPKDPLNRTHHYVKQLKALQEKWGGGKTNAAL